MSLVYLDDERTPPTGWVLAKTPQEAIALLKLGDVSQLSVDHDLGLEDAPAIFDEIKAKTGYDVLLWIEYQTVFNDFVPPEHITVHSANAGARRKMELCVHMIRKLNGQRDE
jgi:hypothetical protein